MRLLTLIFIASLSLLTACTSAPQKSDEKSDLITALHSAATDKLLDKWYPLAIDQEDGGYYSDLTYDFQLAETEQNKMVVTQARHVWTTATAAMDFPERKDEFLSYAEHGFHFLRDHMWDSIRGGFYTLVSKEGQPIIQADESKTAYGNAFAIYGLAAYNKASGNAAALDLAKEAFMWLEKGSHDSMLKGYFQNLHPDGTPIERTPDHPSTSTVGYKDQNSSIHLLEAFTALYEVWPDPLVEARVKEMLLLIRDTITTDKGYLTLFLEKDWTPVSFRDTPRDTIQKHYYLEHVSFGHDVETAYLMLEASHVLGGWQFEETLRKGKIMVDHSLENGWDIDLGGFYDGGYYFKDADTLQIVNAHKNWWSQAEGLNTMLLMHDYFPEDPMDYSGYFEKLWDYTNTYLMDSVNGGWYDWGTDGRPEVVKSNKGHIWKSPYHTYRALVNCAKRFEELGVKE